MAVSMDQVVETGRSPAGQTDSLVPARSPLPMPTQSLRVWNRDDVSRSPLFIANTVRLARWFVFSATGLLTGYASWEMYNVVGQHQATGLQILLVVLFALTFSWIALAAATSVLGFFVVVARRGTAKDASRQLAAQTALVMPIYNEDVIRVCESVGRMLRELLQKGQEDHFDFFLLSDSTDADAIQAEHGAAALLHNDLQGKINFYYRRRLTNKDRKAGNIADFVMQWGGAYDFMLVLDADSYMTADAIVSLTRAMEADPNAGLIQTAPRLMNGMTLFARIQQFSTAVYGPLVASGLALWHGREGNYWGHNAIIRTQAFASACGLPTLPGRKPFGGYIQSHDFVEAALLRRAGFGVYMRPDIEGSYEESPPTLAEHAARDRRWAQGNLQHAKVLSGAGFHWLSRFHLINGIMSYLASPLWFLFLVVGIILSWEAVTFPPEYFPTEFSLFPSWPRFDPERAWSLLGLSALILLLPKILAIVATLTHRSWRRAGGGATALTVSVIVETLVSALLAPIMMLMQTKFVLEILLGRDSGWFAQQRRAKDSSLMVTARNHLPHTVTGLMLAVGTSAISTEVCLWLSPVWFGLSLSIPIVHLTSSTVAGRAARGLHLFETSAPRTQGSCRAASG